MTHQAETLERTNKGQLVELDRVDLPLACPMPDHKVWSAHPRVFLPIEDSGEATCPYCGTRYVLKDA